MQPAAAVYKRSCAYRQRILSVHGKSPMDFFTQVLSAQEDAAIPQLYTDILPVGRQRSPKKQYDSEIGKRETKENGDYFINC